MTKQDISHYQNAAHPKGAEGEAMLDRMNQGTHERLARWGLSHLTGEKSFNTLDIGCGGGANLKRLMHKYPEGVTIGIDVSKTSVEKSKQTMAAAIAQGNCNVLQASADDLPFGDETFDLVTAFETIYFWPHITKCFSEIYRILEPGGYFMICNETDGRTQTEPYSEDVLKLMHVYFESELTDLLESCGFQICTYDYNEQTNWIVCICTKPYTAA